MSSRNSFLISRRNTPLPRIVGNGPSWGFPWERPVRSIGGPSTSTSSQRQWLWTREGDQFYRSSGPQLCA
jgi:hypothetical protein